MKKFLDDVGPLLAGFQIAVSIVGFFGIGAVAKWILEHWLPFTRWIWGEIFAFIQFPEVTTQEKDALTTLAFFAPMAISSFVVWYTRNRISRGGSRDEATSDLAAKELRLRIYASFIGAFFMIIVGWGVIQDTILLFTTRIEEGIAEEAASPLLDIELFARIGLFFAIIGGVIAFSAVLYWLTRRIEVLKKRTDRLFEWLASNAPPIRAVVSSAASSMAAAVIGAMTSLVSFAAVFGGIALAARQLGPIRTAAPMLVLVSLLATIFLDPARLLKTAGVVIALVVASLGWDFAIYVVRAVETAPI
jgi:hypothetical protein